MWDSKVSTRSGFEMNYSWGLGFGVVGVPCVAPNSKPPLNTQETLQVNKEKRMH